VAFGAPPIGAANATGPANKSDRHPKLVSPRIDGFYFLWRPEMSMKPGDLKLMSVDELWALHVEIQSVLPNRIAAEQTKLQRLLQQLKSNGASSGSSRRERRSYPKVLPKYRNPAKPAETWAGRGNQPRWLKVLLKTGKKLDDFRIEPRSGRARRAARR